MAVPN
jgi:hypothetical protein